MAAELTSEGVKVGELLLGAVGEEAEPMLWVVSRVVSKNKIEALAAVRDFEIKIVIKTHGINGDDHQFKRVRFVHQPNSKVLGHVTEF